MCGQYRNERDRTSKLAPKGKYENSRKQNISVMNYYNA